MPERVFEAAFAAACNARHVSVVRRRRLGDFSDDTFVAKAAAHDYTIALADARGSATRIFPSAAAPREQRPSSRAPQIEDPSKLAAMPSDVFEAAFAAACNTKVMRFEHSRRALQNPPNYTLERVFGTTDVDAINELSEYNFQCALAKGKAAADLCNSKVMRFQQSRCSLGNPPKYTLERVFGTTDVDAINELSEGDFQDALEQGKAAAGLKLSPDEAANAATVAKYRAKQREQYYAEKEANNGKSPEFKGDESCAFAARKKVFPEKFEAHLKECESCRNWAYRVSQLTAAPVGAFPSTLSVVKCAAKVQDEAGVRFPGRIVVASYRAAAKAAKRKGGKGAAPPAKRPKK